MKKYFYLFALLTVVMFTSCNDDDETVNKQTLTATVNSRAVNGENTVFSQSSMTFELNYTDNTIQISGEYKDGNGTLTSVNTAAMPITTAASYTYGFTSSDALHVIGYLDMSTGVIWFNFIDGTGCNVYCTTHLYFAYLNTTITDADNSVETDQIDYLFSIDSKGQTCDLYIVNLMPDTRQAPIAQEVKYTSLKLKPSTTGYTVEADEVASSYNGRFGITDFNAVIDQQARHIEGTFKVGETTYTISGNLFRTLQ